VLEFFHRHIDPSSPTRAKLSVHLIAQTSLSSRSLAAPLEDDANEAQGNPHALVLRAGQDSTGVNGYGSSASGARKPISVQDVTARKATLHLSSAPTPVRRLGEFEETP